MPKRNNTKKPIFNDYLNTTTETDQEYRNGAMKALANEFRYVTVYSMRTIFVYFNYHYAPTVEFIEKALDGVDFDEFRIKDISATLRDGKKEDKIVILQILANKRANRGDLVKFTLSGSLKAEIQWMKNRRVIKCSMPKIKKSTKFVAKVVDLVECPVCCQNFLKNEMWPCVDGHLFCTRCLENYARESVYGQSNSNLPCMEIDCETFFSWKTLQKVLNGDLLKQLEERAFEENLNSAEIENLIRCKYCNYAAIMDEPVEVNKVFKCDKCQRETCRNCKVDWNDHFGIPCDEMETDEEEKLRKETEEKMAESVIRRCEKCKAELIKEAGCNKLTCRCGNQMCYLCRQSNVGYIHFCSHFRIPNKPCKQCKNCSLWEDTTKVDIEKLKSVKQEAEESQKLFDRKIRKIGTDIEASNTRSP